MPLREPRLYGSVVRVDDGKAPNPQGEFCTLAICKPEIRRCARGRSSRLCLEASRPNPAGLRDGGSKSISFATYWADRRFQRRCDNIYCPLVDGRLDAITGDVHANDDDRRRDWRGRNVLIAAPGAWWYLDEMRRASVICCRESTSGNSGIRTKDTSGPGLYPMTSMRCSLPSARCTRRAATATRGIDKSPARKCRRRQNASLREPLCALSAS